MKIAIIGCGKQAPKHIQGFRQAGLESIYVSDVDMARARDLAEKEKVHAIEITDIWVDPEIAAVVIATPTRTHAQLIRQALDNGKDFLCEKPLCETFTEAQDIENLARKNGRIGMVGFIYRSVPVFQEVRRLLLDGEKGPLGKLSLGLVRIGGRGSHELWKHKRATGGGVMNEMLVHVLDLALWLFGSPERTSVLASELRRPQRVIKGEEVEVDAEDFVLVRLEKSGGPAVYIEADMLTPAFTQRIEIQGEYGTLCASIQAGEPTYLFLSEQRGDLLPGRHELGVSGSPYAIQSAAFLAAVRERREPDYAGLGEVCNLMQVMETVTQQVGVK